MTTTQKKVVSIGDIGQDIRSRGKPCQSYNVEYAIRFLGIEPTAVAGGIRLYDPSVIAKVEEKLEAIAKRRELAAVGGKQKAMEQVRARIREIAGQRELAGAGK